MLKNILSKLKIILIDILDTYRSYSKRLGKYSTVVYLTKIIRKLAKDNSLYDYEDPGDF